MGKRRGWRCVIVLFLLGPPFWPHSSSRPALSGDCSRGVVFCERPLSYWREVSREHGREGSIPAATASRFRIPSKTTENLRTITASPIGQRVGGAKIRDPGRLGADPMANEFTLRALGTNRAILAEARQACPVGSGRYRLGRAARRPPPERLSV